MSKPIWTNITDQHDIEYLVDTFGGFHDSCIHEMRYLGNGYVDKKLSMGMHDNACLRIIFQRQCLNPPAIEIEFLGITKLCLDIPDNYFPDIFGANMFFHERLIYWANNADWSLDNRDVVEPCDVWLSAKSARWRRREDCIGDQVSYCSPFGEDDDVRNNLPPIKDEGSSI